MTGTVLGEALVIEGKHVVHTRGYGSEARGGVSYVDLAIDEGPIYSFEVSNPDILVILSEQALKKSATIVTEKTVVIVDELIADQVEQVIPNKQPVVLPVIKLAEEYGGAIYTNMILLGMLAGITDLVSLVPLKKAIARRMIKYADKNIAAAEKGYNHVKSSQFLGTSVQEESNVPVIT